MSQLYLPPPRIEPRLKPIKGVVQPPVMPPPDRPGRRTNRLEFISQHFDVIWQHPSAHIFRQPVNAITYKIPTYHDIITHPMDMNTIRQRLANDYYWSAKECLEDFNTMFRNCSKFNPPYTSHHQMGIKVKNHFIEVMCHIPKDEVELPVSTVARTTRATKGRPRTVKSQSPIAKKPPARKPYTRKEKQTMLQCGELIALGKKSLAAEPKKPTVCETPQLEPNAIENFVQKSEISISSPNKNENSVANLSHNTDGQCLAEVSQHQTAFGKGLKSERSIFEIVKGIQLLVGKMQSISNNLVDNEDCDDNQNALQPIDLICRPKELLDVTLVPKRFPVLKYTNTTKNTNITDIVQSPSSLDVKDSCRLLTNSEKELLCKETDAASEIIQLQLQAWIFDNEESSLTFPVEVDELKPTTLWGLYTKLILMRYCFEAPETPNQHEVLSTNTSNEDW